MNRPVALVCYICGREFGTKSLAFHLKACEKKWENEQNLKPPKERRPCPRPPQGLDNLLDKGNISKHDINQYNVKSFDSYVEEALIECQFCHRRFNPTSLIPHQKACRTNPMIKKTFQNKGPLGKHVESEQPIKPASSGYTYKPEPMARNQQGDLVPCRRCGRTFAADRVGKHERVCKAEPVGFKAPQPKVEPRKKESSFKPNFGKEKKAKWKVQSQQLQNAMKMMRQMKAVQARGGKLSDLPPPPRGNYDHYVQCRYCGRKYAPDVAERHIPKCANIINKPGGIKPSKIQDKYIAGTGAKPNSSYVQPKATNGYADYSPSRPVNGYGQIKSNNYGESNYGSSNYNNNYGQIKPNSGYGQNKSTNYGQSKPNYGYGQEKNTGYGGSVMYEKPRTPTKNGPPGTIAKPRTPTKYSQKPQNDHYEAPYKPNLAPTGSSGATKGYMKSQQPEKPSFDKKPLYEKTQPSYGNNYYKPGSSNRQRGEEFESSPSRGAFKPNLKPSSRGNAAKYW